MDVAVLLIFIVVYVSSLLFFLPDTLDNWRRKYGIVFRTPMGIPDIVVINGYSAIKEALEKRGDASSSRPNFRN